MFFNVFRRRGGTSGVGSISWRQGPVARDKERAWEEGIEGIKSGVEPGQNGTAVACYGPVPLAVSLGGTLHLEDPEGPAVAHAVAPRAAWADPTSPPLAPRFDAENETSVSSLFFQKVDGIARADSRVLPRSRCHAESTSSR